MPTEFTIETPANFDLETAVCGHGWYDLAPFKWNAESKSLKYVFRSKNGRSVAVGDVTLSDGNLAVSLQKASVGIEKVKRDVRHILRLDDELEEFYRIAGDVPGAKWAVRKSAGRLLRSATVFEDMVKTMCTTNCSWALTRKMVENLVDKLGEPAGKGWKAFPTAEAMASVNEEFYRNEIKAGYRSPYFVELAGRVIAGEIDTESYLTSDLPTAELKKEIKGIKGFGDYAADNLLKLLGRNDGLALDSWLRARFYEKHNKGKTCPDKKIHKHYSKYREWQGLMIWCDMTEDWFESKQANNP
jgi:3-methyladenine DNA glycosylase/8-oxoguanine DNA glycosylase